MATRTTPALSIFDGTLIRLARNEWAWSDGTPEPRVRDLSACGATWSESDDVAISAKARSLGWLRGSRSGWTTDYPYRGF